MSSLGFEGISWIGAAETREMVDSERYLGAMWEPRRVLVNPARLVREERRVALGLGACGCSRNRPSSRSRAHRPQPAAESPIGS